MPSHFENAATTKRALFVSADTPPWLAIKKRLTRNEVAR